MEIYNFWHLHNAGKLTEQQYKLLSWMGYSNFMNYYHKESKYYYMYLAYSNACEIMGIEAEYTRAVSLGNIEGLINYNRMYSVVTFNENILQYADKKSNQQKQ